MAKKDRSKFMTGFWEHKLLSDRLSGLGYSIDNLRLKAASPSPDGGRRLSSSGACSGADRPPRRMSDSYCEVYLPFRTNSHLLEDYTSIYGGIRIGKILEDLDVLAASIAYLHCDDLDLTIVTAAVDRIDLLIPIDSVIADIRMKGSVTFVGRSSIEVTISVESNHGDDPKIWDLAALAKFILVARSPDGKSSVEVNRLILETDREKEIFNAGSDRHQYRLRRDAESLYRQPPTADESSVVHQICMHRSLEASLEHPLKLVPIRETHVDALRICHPQERNIHNYIFGGYMCREAFELAFANASLFFGGQRPSLKSIDEISFVHPVPIGSLVNFGCEIVYSKIVEDHNMIAIQVVADVINSSTNDRLTTNTFRFTMSAPINDAADVVPAVLPETYVEAMKYLEAKRRTDFTAHESTSRISARFSSLFNEPKTSQ